MATAAAGESDSSSGSSDPNPPKWALLDRYVFTRRDLAAACEEDSPECSCTSQGLPFRISLRYSAPPATSRFYLHMPAGAADHHCRILGSHRDALLFSMYVPLPNPADDDYRPQGVLPTRFFKQELFVYVAGNNGSTPTLTAIPPCTGSMEELEDGDDDDDDSSFPPDDGDYYDNYSYASDDDADSFFALSDDEDIVEQPDDDDDDDSVAAEPEQFYNPLAGIIQFSDLQAVGVLCSNDDNNGDFVVAHLCVSRCITRRSGADEFEAQMCLYYSSESKWELHGLPISYRDDNVYELCRWSCSRVITFGAYLCWVDYNCGILFCEVFNQQRPLKVTYLSLPVDDAHLFNEVCMDMYRNVCAVEDDEEAGTMKLKFIDVTPSHGYIFRPPPSQGFEMNMWNLVVSRDGTMNWEHECVIRDNDLNISSLVVPSPHGPLTFPVFSMEEPHVVYFAVGEHGYRVKKVWLVPVDLISRSAKYVFPYLKGEEDLLGDDADMARKKPYCFEPFLPCDANMFFPQALPCG